MPLLFAHMHNWAMFTPDDILNFWFAETSQSHWFARDDDFDADIRRRFAVLYEHVRDGAHLDWKDSPRGLLALIIILDQFPRNMFRDSPQAFASDDLALTLAELTIAKGFNVRLSPQERMFAYMPLQHAEKIDVQEQAVARFAEIEMDMPLDFAKQHRDIIARFGRFPHRNAVLGRASTAEETEFLKTHPGF